MHCEHATPPVMFEMEKPEDPSMCVATARGGSPGAEYIRTARCSQTCGIAVFADIDSDSPRLDSFLVNDRASKQRGQ